MLERYWKKYNEKAQDPTMKVVATYNGEKVYARTYSHLFFEGQQLHGFLNQDYKRMLQLGASLGEFLEDYKNEGWDVMGYDYIPAAISAMHDKNVPCKFINLDSIDEAQLQLSYKEELTKDLSLPTNILAVRIMQYLSPEAVKLLMFNLMDLSACESTIVIINSVTLDGSPQKETEKPHYFSSYFGGRTDFLFLQDKVTHEKAVTRVQRENQKDDSIDQITIVRKLRK